MAEEESAPAAGKRPREEDEAAGASPEPASESKRMRVFFDILEDESEPDNTDLDSVMRSLEEELSLPVPDSGSDPVEGLDSDLGLKQPDLGFLLEASDDELGLPPAEGELASSDATAGEEAPEEAEEVGFEKIWGIDDDDLRLDFGLGAETSGTDDGGAVFDGGLFDDDGGVCGFADFSDLAWRPEFLPAV